VIANIIHNILSSALIIIAFIFIKDIQLNYLACFLGILLATAFHTILGLYMAYFQKNFTDMLVSIMTIIFLLMIPTVLFQLNVLKGAAWEYILLINPMQSAAEIINGGFVGFVFTWKYYLGIAYMLFGSIAIYFGLVLPKFKDYAIKQSGV
jgi:fluoroquinolone transport system permease protein